MAEWKSTVMDHAALAVTLDYTLLRIEQETSGRFSIFVFEEAAAEVERLYLTGHLVKVNQFCSNLRELKRMVHTARPRR